MVKSGRTSATSVSAIKSNGEANISIDQANDQPSSPLSDWAFSINQSAPSTTKSSTEMATTGGDAQITRCDVRITRIVSRGRGTPKSAKIASTIGTTKAR